MFQDFQVPAASFSSHLPLKFKVRFHDNIQHSDAEYFRKLREIGNRAQRYKNLLNHHSNALALQTTSDVDVIGENITNVTYASATLSSSNNSFRANSIWFDKVIDFVN